MALDNYPDDFNETLLNDTMAELRAIVEDGATIEYELKVRVDGDEIYSDTSRGGSSLKHSVNLAQAKVNSHLNDMTDRRYEREMEGDDGEF